MRFSTVALLIALPATAYAAAFAQQDTTCGLQVPYGNVGDYCVRHSDCCSLVCIYDHRSVEDGNKVCPSAYTLPLADQDISIATKRATLLFCRWSKREVIRGLQAVSL